MLKNTSSGGNFYSEMAAESRTIDINGTQVTTIDGGTTTPDSGYAGDPYLLMGIDANRDGVIDGGAYKIDPTGFHILSDLYVSGSMYNYDGPWESVNLTPAWISVTTLSSYPSYSYLCTLPAPSGITYDGLWIEILGQDWTVGPTRAFYMFKNRNGFSYYYWPFGNYSTNRIVVVCYSQSDGRVDVYLRCNESYTRAILILYGYHVNTEKSPTIQKDVIMGTDINVSFSGTVPSGTLVFEPKFDSVKHTPSLLNGWNHIGGSYQTAYYYRQGNIVHLGGSIWGGTASTAFVLPEGYRPPLIQMTTGLRYGGGSYKGTRINILQDGSVQVVEYSGASWVSLDGISFYVNN